MAPLASVLAETEPPALALVGTAHKVSVPVEMEPQESARVVDGTSGNPVLAETEPPALAPVGTAHKVSARVVMEPRESAQAVMAPPALGAGW